MTTGWYLEENRKCIAIETRAIRVEVAGMGVPVGQQENTTATCWSFEKLG
jgi:hypothetical protein